MSVILSQEESLRKGSHHTQSPLSKAPTSGHFQELMHGAPVEEKLKEEEPIAEASFTPASSLALSQASLTASPIQKTLSLELDALFEKIASRMIVMHSEKETETTVFFDNPSSLFHGATITIREYSTAPKVFNVEIAGSFQATAAIESGKSDLLSAFQSGHFNFSIHRLDTHIQSEERPVLHRHESEDSGSQDGKEGGGS